MTYTKQYSRHGKTCVLPGMGFRDEVLLAPQHIQWLASQPDQVLSPVEGFREIDKGDWNSGHRSYIQDPWQSIVIKQRMNQVLNVVVEAVNDELQVALPAHLPQDPSHSQDVDIYEAMKWVVARISSRFIVGLPLCQ